MESWASIGGRVALVTGGGRGLGAAIARGLGRAGAKVVVLGRSRVPLEETAARLSGDGVSCATLLADVSDEAAVNAAMTTLVAEHGGLDILVNNAGINVREGLSETSLATWQRILATNLTGPFLVSRAARPHLRRGARIINVGSIAGEIAMPTGVAYAAAKGGLHHLTRSLAQELAPDGITVNAVAPWYFRTDLTAPVLDRPEYLARVLAETPLRRVGDPDEDLAGVVTFLAGPAAGYITGQVLAVDGGMSIARFDAGD